MNTILAAGFRTLGRLVRRFIIPDNVEWIVNDNAELGVRIFGRCFFLYKGRSLEYDGKHDDGSQMMVRPVGKREFGECCLPVRQPLMSPHYTDGDGWEPMRCKPNTQAEGRIYRTLPRIVGGTMEDKQ